MFDSDKAQKILARMLGTPHEGERNTAARKLVEMVQSAGIAPSDVLVVPRGAEPGDIRDRDTFIFDYLLNFGVTDFHQFVDWLKARDEKLTESRDRYRTEYLRLDAENQKLKETVARQRTTRGKITELEQEITRLKAEIARQQGNLDQARTQPEPAPTISTNDEISELIVFRDAVFDSLERLGIHPDGLENAIECLEDEISDLIAYREEDGETQATIKREWRALHPARYGWKSKLHDLLSRRGLRRAKGTVYAWVSGRSQMPGDVVQIIRQEAARLRDAGYQFMSDRWWGNELAGAATS